MGQNLADLIFSHAIKFENRFEIIEMKIYMMDVKIDKCADGAACRWVFESATPKACFKCCMLHAQG